MAKKQRTQYVLVKVVFDKPVSSKQAADEFRNCIHGDFYPGDFSEADLMTIRTVRAGKPPDTKAMSTSAPKGFRPSAY